MALASANSQQRITPELILMPIAKPLLCFLALAFSLIAQPPRLTAQSEPVVARVQMRLALGEKVLDTIEPGDLLTVLNEREKSFVIQTFNGQKGAVAKVNVAKLAEATPVYDKLIEKTPAEGRLYTLRASCHWALGDTKSALADYDRAIELGYVESHAFASRGLFHSAIGNYPEAVDDFTTAIEKDPKDDVPLLNRASVFMATGEYESAVEDYQKAAKLRPDNPTVHTQLAVAHKLLGKLDLAVKDYDKAIELQEQDVSAWMGRGFVRFQLQQHREAIEDFSRVIELSPKTAVAFNNRGYNRQLLGEEAKALEDFSQAIELAPKYVLALQNKAWLLTISEDETLRDPLTAMDIATKVCELSEFGNFNDLVLLAAAHASGKEFETAIGWQEKAVDLAEGDAKKLAEKVLELYREKKPIDPKLLEAQSAPTDE